MLNALLYHYRLVLRHEQLHYTPADKVCHCTHAEDNHISGWLAIEAHESEGRALCLGVGEEVTDDQIINGLPGQETIVEGYQVININTDGVAFVDNGEGDYEAVCRRWEQEFEGLSLDVDEFDNWIQKDVNNYIAVTPAGHIKTKGGETNKYSENLWFKNNSCRIIQMALVDRLLKINGADRPLLSYLNDRKNDPLIWQYILKAGSTYLRVENSLGEKCQNVNRVFAVTDRCPEITKLYKIRQDGGRVNFPDVPERMAIFNEDLSSADFYDRVGRYLDIEHYYHIIMNKLEGWPDVH